MKNLECIVIKDYKIFGGKNMIALQVLKSMVEY